MTGFHSQLLPNNKDPKLNVDYVIKKYLAAGVPPAKLNVGVPMYGQGWDGVGVTNNGLYQPGTGVATQTFKVLDGYLNPPPSPLPAPAAPDPEWQAFRQTSSKGFWIFSAPTFQFYTYDDKVTAKLKAGYAKDNNLGGLFFWEIGGENAAGALTKAMRTELDKP
jgi:chitinase